MIEFKMILLGLKILSTQTLEMKLCLLDVSDLISVNKFQQLI